MVQWLGLYAPCAGDTVLDQFLIREPRSHMPRDAAKNNNNNNKF